MKLIIRPTVNHIIIGGYEISTNPIVSEQMLGKEYHGPFRYIEICEGQLCVLKAMNYDEGCRYQIEKRLIKVEGNEELVDEILLELENYFKYGISQKYMELFNPEFEGIKVDYGILTDICPDDILVTEVSDHFMLTEKYRIHLVGDKYRLTDGYGAITICEFTKEELQYYIDEMNLLKDGLERYFNFKNFNRVKSAYK